MLEKFNKEVLALGAAACLPANLTDEWLVCLADQLSFIQDKEELSPLNEAPACALAAIFTILIYKNGGQRVHKTVEEIFFKMQEYQMEIELEKMRRWSDIECNSATLDNIFTGREVNFTGPVNDFV